ncbi:hypothetical protein EB061_01950 [bacterium]|jgi:hypothetical protein|nr:hypothetical protein [bacterium]
MDHPESAQSVREVLLRELRAAGASAQLLAGLENASDPEISAWKHAINDSPYDPRDWARSLTRFDAWAMERGLEIPLERMLGYLSCCIEGAGPQTSLLPLETLLSHYLATQGVR